MAIDRFSRGPQAADVASEYIPMPVEFLAGKVQQKQQAFDMAEATLKEGEDLLYGVKGLRQDEPRLREIQAKYSKDLDNALAENDGDYGQMIGYARSVGRDLKRNLTSGELSAISGNYSKGMAWQADLADRMKTSKISREQYQGALGSTNFAGTNYKAGAFESFDGYTPSDYYNVSEATQKIGKNLAEQYDAKGQKFQTTKRSSQLIQAQLLSDQQARESLLEEVRFENPNATNTELNAAFREKVKRHGDVAGAALAFQQIKVDPNVTDKRGNRIATYVNPVTGNAMYNRNKDYKLKLVVADVIGGKDDPDPWGSLVERMTKPASEVTRERYAKREKPRLETDPIADNIISNMEATGHSLPKDPRKRAKAVSDYIDKKLNSTISTPVQISIDEKDRDEANALLTREDVDGISRFTSFARGLEPIDEEGNKVPYSDLKDRKEVYYAGTITNPTSPYELGTTLVETDSGMLYLRPTLDKRSDEDYFLNRVLSADHSATDYNTFQWNGQEAKVSKVCKSLDPEEDIFTVKIGTQTMEIPRTKLKQQLKNLK